MAKPLPLSFFRRPADVVAPELIGCQLIVTRSRDPQSPGRLVASITEVEAYLGTTDPGSHVWKGRRTPTVENLYAPPGTWYVYKSHGLHWCANLTTLGPDEGHAVLLRGVVAQDALTLKQFRRRRGSKVAEKNLSDGPGKMTQALGISVDLDGQQMASSYATVSRGTKHETPVVVTPRIGLTRAVDWPLRWVVK